MQALPESQALPIPEGMPKEHLRILSELEKIKVRLGMTINEMAIYLSPGAISLNSSPETWNMYKLLQHMQYNSMSAIHMARNAVIVMYYMRKGVKFA